MDSKKDNEESDEICDIDIVKRNIGFRSRRVSVFSKSFDPENDDEFENKLPEISDSPEESSSPKQSFSPTANKDRETIINEIYEKNFQLKNREQRVMLRNVLSSIVIFKYLYDEDMESVIDCMFERKCGENETIIKEGDNGNYFYVILNGMYKVFKADNFVVEYNNTGYFGELALLYNQVRLIFRVYFYL